MSDSQPQDGQANPHEPTPGYLAGAPSPSGPPSDNAQPGQPSTWGSAPGGQYQAPANPTPFNSAPSNSAPSNSGPINSGPVGANPYGNPAQQPANPYGQQYAQSSNAMIALILSIVGAVCCCTFMAPVGLYLGRSEMKAIDDGLRDPSQRGLAQAAFVVGIIGTGMLALTALYYVGSFLIVFLPV